MSEQEIFRLQNEIEQLKNSATLRIPAVMPILAFSLMAGGILVSFFGQQKLGYNLGLIGFAGFAIVYGLKSYFQRREQNIEYRILEIKRKIEELRKN